MNESEIVECARRIYDRDLKGAAEQGNQGKYIVIDVNSSDYAVGEDYFKLSKLVRSRHPDANLATLKIGHRTIGRIGARVRSPLPDHRPSHY